jgi:hypothetical protein
MLIFISRILISICIGSNQLVTSGRYRKRVDRSSKYLGGDITNTE